MVVQEIPTDMSHTIRIADVARQQGVHVNTVRRWIDRGYVQFIWTPYGRAIVTESLQAFVQQRRSAIEQEAAS